jgi:Holliday junction resolvase RusA-like endonuclease
VVVVPGNPVPASRPKVSRWGVYYGKRYTAWKKHAETNTPKGPGEILGPLTVHVECVVEKPRTSKLTHPKGDADNYAKGPLDVLTRVGGYWHDDDQIVRLLSIKRFADPGETPRTIIGIYPWKP